MQSTGNGCGIARHHGENTRRQISPLAEFGRDERRMGDDAKRLAARDMASAFQSPSREAAAGDILTEVHHVGF